MSCHVDATRNFLLISFILALSIRFRTYKVWTWFYCLIFFVTAKQFTSVIRIWYLAKPALILSLIFYKNNSCSKNHKFWNDDFLTCPEPDWHGSYVLSFESGAQQLIQRKEYKWHDGIKNEESLIFLPWFNNFNCRYNPRRFMWW